MSNDDTPEEEKKQQIKISDLVANYNKIAPISMPAGILKNSSTI